MHETPSRDRGDGGATRQPRGLGPGRFKNGGLPASGCAQDGAAPKAGMGCGAKRIRSLCLPWMTGVIPKLSPTNPPKGLASLSTINGATMRLCRADLPASAHSSRLPFGAAQCPEPAEGEAAPTAFLLTEPTARREGRPYPPSYQVARACCGGGKSLPLATVDGE
jgi:hypothetical protein